MKISQILGLFVLGMITSLVVAIITGFILSLLWGFVVPVVLPGLVANGTIAGSLDPLMGICLMLIISLLNMKVNSSSK